MKESYRQKPLLTLAAGVAAMALLLAGCGGGSSSPPPMPDPPPPMPDPTPPGPTAESIKADAADAVTAALAASMAADQAKKDAIKYADMLTSEAVKGDSAMAVANAQMVLDAEMAANNAVMDADEALEAAMATKTAAEALPADDADRASAIAAAERAVEQATTQKKAAMAIVDTPEDATNNVLDSLKGAVAMVKGTNPLEEGMPADFGKTVANDVKTAIAALTSSNVATSGNIANATSMDGIKNDYADIGAMTWAMIVGESNVMMERIGLNNAALPVASIAGMAASDVDKTAGTPVLSATGGSAGDGKYPDAASQGTATVTGTPGTEYKGIPGAVWCLGGTDGCSVNADGTLSSGWYFTPTDEDQLYVAGTGGTYMMATMYATYGYWLTYASNAVSTVVLHASSPGNGDNLDLGQAGEGADATDVTATYRGSAVGISAHGDKSGQFTADVSLTAKFAVVPTLRGSISNFQGNAVGNWSVLLNETNLDATAADHTTGTTAGGGAPGTWTADGYGPSPVDHDNDGTTLAVNQRPTGFFGQFSANFGDGSAAGAYTTRVVE